jgi:hypothetical protein
VSYRENYALIDWSKDLEIERKPKEPAARSGLPMPMILSDTIEPTKSMVDGKYYTSKAAIRATYKPSGNAEGKSFVEVGNEQQDMNPRPYVPDKKGIRKAVEEACSQVGLS